jgi:copper resistance protein C
VARSSRIAVAGALLLGGVIATQVLAAGTASAHDELLSTDPAADSTVATVPSVVTLTFAEPPLTLGLGVDVTGPRGTVSAGAPTLSGSDVRQAIRPGAPPGTYTVRWRVTADDGHPVSGSFTFVASAAGAGAAPSGSPVATTATGPTTVAIAADDQARPLIWWGILGAVVVLLVAAVTLAATRRRNRPGGGDAVDDGSDVSEPA